MRIGTRIHEMLDTLEPLAGRRMDHKRWKIGVSPKDMADLKLDMDVGAAVKEGSAPTDVYVHHYGCAFRMVERALEPGEVALIFKE